jgi:hypothetical protein
MVKETRLGYVTSDDVWECDEQKCTLQTRTNCVCLDHASHLTYSCAARPFWRTQSSAYHVVEEILVIPISLKKVISSSLIKILKMQENSYRISAISFLTAL